MLLAHTEAMAQMVGLQNPGTKTTLFFFDSLSKTGYLKLSVFTPGPGSKPACMLSLAFHSGWLPPRSVTIWNEQDIDLGTTYSWREK